MAQDTQPAHLNAAGGEDHWGAYRVEHPGEMRALMRQLRDRGEAINLNAPEGHMLTTTLWAIDDQRERLNFSVQAEAAGLPALVEAEEVVAVAYLDSIKLQFELRDLVLVRSAQSAALQSALPGVLYRFQRRNAYRVRTLERGSPTAHLRHPALPDMALGLRVLDVSIGGCALFLPNDVPAIEPGTEFAQVRVELDGTTRFESGLRVQHVSSVGPGQRGVRLGCEWVRLSGSAERALQRYIDQTQKQRRLMSLD
jgi:c-di-GMP-binding flagellar brake protein YcgR